MKFKVSNVEEASKNLSLKFGGSKTLKSQVFSTFNIYIIFFIICY